MIKVLFVFNSTLEPSWRDGLWAALIEMSKDSEFEITTYNLQDKTYIPVPSEFDFVLGWGAFGSNVDNYMKRISVTKGLCIAGNAIAPGKDFLKYDVLFYETEWIKDWLFESTGEQHPCLVHAFGTNTDIYRPIRCKKMWDYTTVGAFALWKRQNLLLNKPGLKLAIGEVQEGNTVESLGIVARLLAGNVMVSNHIEPEKLALLYNMSKHVYIPADLNGGGERAVLEARACDIPVEVESDNPKLIELLTSPIWDHKYYSEQLKKGIKLCLLI